MRFTIFAFFLLAIAGLASAQESWSGHEVAARVREGGWFEQSKWRRGDDGALEMHFFADIGEVPDRLRFKPLLGGDLTRGIENCGLFGFLSIVCHGWGDLLSMTDAEFHLGALGVDTSDVGLRQYLVVPAPTFEGGRGRAELMDRMLAIDLLVRRGCKPAVPELRVIAAGESPTPLRNRARRAMDRLEGRGDTGARRRLTPETLNLPLGFDGCIVVDHSRLPDLGWMTPLARRLGALITASKIKGAGGTVSEPQLNGAQSMCDIVSELPFGLAHRYGNARLDHSVIVITAKADPKMPVALSWQAAGEFEHEGWQDAAVPARLVRNNPLLGGNVDVTADRLKITVGGGAGKPRLDKAKELLRDTGLAIRAIAPRTSKLWPALRFLDLPAALGGELRVSFGDPAVVVVMVEARDDEDAEEWVERGKEVLAGLTAQLEASVPAGLRDREDVQRIIDAVAGAAFSVKDSAAFAVVELRGVTADTVRDVIRAGTVRDF